MQAVREAGSAWRLLCWFELPRVTIHWFFEEGGTAFKALDMHVSDLLISCSIFNLFFPLGVHWNLAGWHLISFYYIVLPKAVILTLSLMMSLDFWLFFSLAFKSSMLLFACTVVAFFCQLSSFQNKMILMHENCVHQGDFSEDVFLEKFLKHCGIEVKFYFHMKPGCFRNY